MTQRFNQLEKHFCSLKWSQRLKEIGVRQDTTFRWLYRAYDETWHIISGSAIINVDEYNGMPICAAFSAHDFIDLFPKLFKIARNNDHWKFLCEYAEMELKDEHNLADVFARILVSITKNKNEMKKIT